MNEARMFEDTCTERRERGNKRIAGKDERLQRDAENQKRNLLYQKIIYLIENMEHCAHSLDNKFQICHEYK